MATGGDSTPTETLDCPVCLQQFLIPRTLPCLHTVCQKCLDIHINQQGKRDCPLCYAEIAPLDTTISEDKWASAFPLNEFIQSLIKAQNKCYNEMEQNVQSTITFDQNCTRHSGHKLETFCVNHRALCCGVCFATIHRDCGDMRAIHSAAEDQAKRCTYHDIITQIRKIKTDMDTILADKMDNRSQIKTEKEQIINTMDIRIDQVIKNLNELRISFKHETENFYQVTNNSIVKSEKQIKSFQTTIANSEQIMESLENKASSREKFIALETLRSQVTSHYERLKLTTQDEVEIHFSLTANAALRDIEGLSSLGVIQTSSAKPKSFLKTSLKNADDVIKKLSSMSKLNTTLSAAQIAKPMTSRITFVKDVSRQKYGRGTWFSGGTVLPDGRLLMADFNNGRLLQLDEDCKIVKEYTVDGNPSDVAAGQTNNEIYMAVYKDGYYVYKCRLDTGLTVVSRIEAPYLTWGIAVSDENIIVGAFHAVVILNQDETTVKSITKTGYNCYVAASQTQRTMYHTDNADVVCRTLEGRELFTYRHQQLEFPMGICTDTHGRTYICGRYSHNVHQVSPDGKTSTVLELHTISEPWCCVFLPQRNKLFVTSHSGDTALEVYKLE